MKTLRPLSVLIVEDEALIAMELQLLVEDAGHALAGWATTREEAGMIAETCAVDLALVDVHLADGVSGTHLAAELRERKVQVLFMTANAKRLPEDFAGALGVLAKPYTSGSVIAALDYLQMGVLDPPPSLRLPMGLTLSPAFAERWSAVG